MKLMKVNHRFDRQMFPSIFDNWFDFDLARLPGSDSVETMPAINVLEKNDGFELQVAAPGFSKADFKVNVENEVLTISAETENKSDEEKSKYTRCEYSYGTFRRSFTLPDTVDGDKIEAGYNEGILKVFIPKQEEAKVKAARMIKIS